MVKRILVSALAFGLVGLVCLVGGCGQGGSSSTTITPSSVTFSGTAAAASSDLSKLGVTALSVNSSSTLKAMGFTEQSIKALNLVPLAAGDAAVTLNKVNSDGSYTLVVSTTIGTGSSYSLTDSSYDPNNTYVIKITKSNSTASKQMVLEAIVDSTAATGSSTAAVTSINTSPQTTLLLQIVKEKVIEALGTATIEPQVVNLIKDLVVSKINGLITSEGLSVSAVYGLTDSENTALKNAATQCFSDPDIQKAINSVRFKTGLTKGAVNLPTAKKIIKEIFTYITGSPSMIPENIINSFAQSYVNGVTKTVDQLAAACDKASTKNGQPTTEVFTAANISAALIAKISGTYQAASGPVTGDNRFEVKAQNPVVQALFPPSEWLNKSINGSTTLSVPQIIIMVEIANSIAEPAGAVFNPPKAAYEMGLMSGVANKYQIMHSEIRIESYEDWENFRPTREADRPAVSAILTSNVEVSNLANPTASGNLSAKLFYKKANGTDTSIDYKRLVGRVKPASVKSLGLSAKAEMGPPPGFVVFQIRPWGEPGTTITPITDYLKGSIATIKVYDSNSGTEIEIDSKEVTISSVNLTSAAIQFKTPSGDIYDPTSLGASVFQAGTKPVCEWTFGTAESTTRSIDFGSLKSAYAIEVRSVEAQNTGQGTVYMANFSAPAIYSSWNRQDFIEGNENESASFTIPSALAAGNYAIMGAVVALDAAGWPVVSGPWRSTTFKVGAEGVIQAKSVTISGEVTPPSPSTSGTTIKVGLFKMKMDNNFGGATITPESVVTVSNNRFSMTINYSDLVTAGPGGYDTIAWEDNNSSGTSGKLDGASAERPYFPSKHLGFWGGSLNAMNSTFQPLGPVNATSNNTGYNIDMSQQFWGP